MSSVREPLSTRARLTPILTLASACIFALAASYVLGLFADIAADQEVALNPWTLFILEHRQWMFVVVAPAILLSIVGLSARNGFVRMVLAMLSGLSLAGALAIIVYAAIGVLGPMYQYQPL